MDKQQFIKECESLYDKLSASMLRSTSAVQFADHNFRISTEGWKIITVNKKVYHTNPEKDVWAILKGRVFGEQRFTWDAMMRETEKAGKRVPTDEEFDILLRTKEDMPNLVLAGIRGPYGAFLYLGSGAYFWSSSQSSSISGISAWGRGLSLSESRVIRFTYSKTHCFSVRCLKD